MAGRPRSAGPADREGAALRFVLDADLRPKAALAARGLGLDVVTVPDTGLGEAADDELLAWAAKEGRVVVTRNRDDFIEWTATFFHRAAPHAGVLIVPWPLTIRRPERLAHALRRWTDRMNARLAGQPLGPYYIDFLGE